MAEEFVGQWPYEPQEEAKIRQRKPGEEGIYNPDPNYTLSELISTILPFEQQRQGLTDWRSQDTANEAMMWLLPGLSKLGKASAVVPRNLNLLQSVKEVSKPVQKSVGAGIPGRIKQALNVPIERRDFLSGLGTEVKRELTGDPNSLTSILSKVGSKHKLDESYILDDIADMFIGLGTENAKTAELHVPIGNTIKKIPYGKFTRAMWDQYEDWPFVAQALTQSRSAFRNSISLKPKEADRVWAMVNNGKLEDASEYVFLKSLEKSQLPKEILNKAIQRGINRQSKLVKEFGEDATYTTSGEHFAPAWIKAMKKAISDTGMSWDAVGRLQLPTKRLKELDSIGSEALNQLSDLAIETGTKAANKVTEKLGETELSRRQFLGLGGKKAAKEKPLADRILDNITSQRGSFSNKPIDLAGVRKAKELRGKVGQKEPENISNIRKSIEEAGYDTSPTYNKPEGLMQEHRKLNTGYSDDEVALLYQYPRTIGKVLPDNVWEAGSALRKGSLEEARKFMSNPKVTPKYSLSQIAHDITWAENGFDWAVDRLKDQGISIKPKLKVLPMVGKEGQRGSFSNKPLESIGGTSSKNIENKFTAGNQAWVLDDLRKGNVIIPVHPTNSDYGYVSVPKRLALPYKEGLPWDDLLSQLKKGEYASDSIREDVYEKTISNELARLYQHNKRSAKKEATPIKSSLLDFIKSERGSFSNKPIKKEGHHTLPVGQSIEALNWHLRNPEEGWKTIQDIPKDVHKKLTKKQAERKSAEKAITPEERKAALVAKATTPERQQLLEEVYPRLEEYIKTVPEGSNVYAFGSYASPKPNPQDLDLFTVLNTVPRNWGFTSEGLPKMTIDNLLPRLQSVVTPYKPAAEKMKQVAIDNYGPHDWIKLLSTIGAMGIPLSEIIGKE